MLHPLEILKDRITDSQTHESSIFIDQDDIRVLRLYIPNLTSYIPSLQKIHQRLGTTLNIIDYDDTLQRRHYQLQEGILQDNRGKRGNKVIDEVLGRENFLSSHYRRDSIVKRIAQILEMQNERHAARILTAGETTWQTQKTKETGLYDEKEGIIVVDEASKKIQKLLDTVLSLGYIPSKIIIYEDRPEHFQKAAQALSKFLGGVEVVVNHVILSQKEVTKRQIEEIYQGIYISR